MQEENSEASPSLVAAKNMYIVDWLGGTLPFFYVSFAAATSKFKRSSNFSEENLFLGIKKGLSSMSQLESFHIYCSRIDVNGIYCYKRSVIKIVSFTMHTADLLVEDC